MERKKNTRVIALTDFSPAGNSAVRHAASLAVFFESSLLICTQFSFEKEQKVRTRSADFDQIIAEYRGKVEIHVDDMPYHLAEIHALAETGNHIMFVIGVDKGSVFNVRRALKFIAPSRLPVMVVGPYSPRDERWQNVMLPVEVNRPAKEKALWAGYFQRFGKSAIHVLHNDYHDKISVEKMDDILQFIDKLYGNIEVTPTLHSIEPPVDDVDAYALQHIDKYQAAVLVIMTTTHKTLIDLLFGTREQALIGNKEGLPVLCINERDDLFVLCT